MTRRKNPTKNKVFEARVRTLVFERGVEKKIRQKESLDREAYMRDDVSY